MSLGLVPRAPSWQEALPGLGWEAHGCSVATDLLEKMLELDVDKRLTAAQALAHPFFEPFRDPEEETEAQQPFDDALEHQKLTVDEWKRKSQHPAPPSLPSACRLVFMPGPTCHPGTPAPFPPSGHDFPCVSLWTDLLLHEGCGLGSLLSTLLLI